ncbi:hypothetical protein [Lentilactobacillus parabuchneri]|jgi:hypothetical protein|nr:hypothetical protein [Lentilactobacillus parabuchneri]ORM91127.1 hypothetical protein FAM21809_02193 [Lentilactobacillus parabuchneri]ORN13639.1 hypothetical protein FAM23164_02164 [Lentilactobacillus parabuchneri]ORN15409.1 hypothetical protein FAM23165_02204 [Lentilactobacillus parabuchneri]ORN18374.1 hypothetical protein FAM23166_02206 [Lentilactobacillus parabuchneri]ORN23821.1 hypothetical protein FAM23167_02239 [Lentilactobacillus parabuchneri]
MENLSEIEGMKIPQYSSEEIRERLSKDDLWDLIINVYPDLIKK